MAHDFLHFRYFSTVIDVYFHREFNYKSGAVVTIALPDSAISSWGGFAYQGKVALYHSICLLCDKSFLGIPLANFDLQLDSTDDFAIYHQGNAVSVHQVKAKISPYRSAFAKALSKSSKIDTDCNAATQRYFHIANEINDASDYTNSVGGVVKFYQYGTDSHCKLEDIEKFTRTKIEEYLIKNSLPCTEILLERKYCHLSELITSKVIEIHAAIHSGETENHAAYTKTITSSDLENIVLTDFNEVSDIPYTLIKLRMTVSYAFEWYVATNTDYFSVGQIKDCGAVYRFIYGMHDDDLQLVMQSLRPNGNESDIFRPDDILGYIDIILEITRAISLNGLPHYLKDLKRYLPTSVTLKDRWAPGFKKELLERIRTNPKLASVLYEYNTLITGSDTHSEITMVGESDKITSIHRRQNLAANIIREIPVSIISTEAAKKELNA